VREVVVIVIGRGLTVNVTEADFVGSVTEVAMTVAVTALFPELGEL